MNRDGKPDVSRVHAVEWERTGDHPLGENAASSDDGLLICRPARYGLLAFGWLNVALGVIGIIVPVMPTTIFLIIALWAFSRCSVRFHRWLYNHPVLGRTLREWHAHRVIPVRAKCLAVGMMAIGLIYVTAFVADGWALPLGLASVLAAVSGYILSRPGRLAGGAEGGSAAG